MSFTKEEKQMLAGIAILAGGWLLFWGAAIAGAAFIVRWVFS